MHRLFRSATFLNPEWLFPADRLLCSDIRFTGRCLLGFNIMLPSAWQSISVCTAMRSNTSHNIFTFACNAMPIMALSFCFALLRITCCTDPAISGYSYIYIFIHRY
eukprot:scpid91569/ scgid19848/ 